jgi:hypothetical protein
MKKKTVVGIIALSLLAVITAMVLVAAAPENEVYFVPKESKAPFCVEKEVEIRANASDFYGGQINLTYEPTCANVTNWVRNTTNFPLGGWSHYNGKEWITFTKTSLPLLTGEYMIGTLTIHCVNESEEGCEILLAFIEPSMLLNDTGKPVTANWVNGTFECIRTTTPTTTTTTTTTPTPTSQPSINGFSVSTHTLTPKPEQTPATPVTTSPSPALSPSPSPTPAASPLTSPTHTPAPTPTPTIGGFEAVFVIIILALSYLPLKWRKGIKR